MILNPPTCNLNARSFATLVTFSNVVYYVVDILDVLDSVTELFETKYERGLRRADRAISEQIDLVHVSFLSTTCFESLLTHFLYPVLDYSFVKDFYVNFPNCHFQERIFESQKVIPCQATGLHWLPLRQVLSCLFI